MLEKPQTIFFLGIGGAGMRALAYLLSSRGHRIIGSDVDVSKIPAVFWLQKENVVPEDAAEALFKEATLLIYTDAAPETHPLRQAAEKHGIPQLMLFEAVGEFAKAFTTIAICGTHGKSSTTAFIGHILTEAGIDPTVQVGAALSGWDGQNARVGKSQYFVIEADEYRRHFLHLNPTHIVLTSVDFDHPDYFTSLADAKAAFAEFIKKLVPGGWVFVPAAVYREHPDLPWPQHTQVVESPQEAITVSLPGQHMQSNAALALALVEKLGVNETAGRQALKSFPGLGRRFERLGKIGSLDVISDYGHHPTEIAATLAAAKEASPNNKILAVIEPHTTQRVDAYLMQYVAAASDQLSAGVVLYPTFYVVGRDDPQKAAQASQRLLQAMRDARQGYTHAVDTIDALKQLLLMEGQRYDQVIAFSAGSLDQQLRLLLANLS